MLILALKLYKKTSTKGEITVNINKIKEGLKVKTAQKLGDTKGIMVQKHHLDARKAGAIGHINGFVAGHGGDVWWIKHLDGTIGAYMFKEFSKA